MNDTNVSTYHLLHLRLDTAERLMEMERAGAILDFSQWERLTYDDDGNVIDEQRCFGGWYCYWSYGNAHPHIALKSVKIRDHFDLSMSDASALFGGSYMGWRPLSYRVERLDAILLARGVRL